MESKKNLIPKYSRHFNDSLPKFDKSVSLLCWAYNEEELIGEYLVRAHKLLERTVNDYEIVLVDDCSTDGTNRIVKSLMTEIPQIRLIRNSVNMNVGYSSQIAIKCATKDYIFWQTIDWSYDITYLRIFLELLKSYDIVAGVRRDPVETVDRTLKPILGVVKLFGIKHVTRRSDTVPKAIVSIINYILIRCLFNVPISDYQNVVFYPRNLIQSIHFQSNSSFSNPEALIKSYWRGASIIEVPISFLPRKSGLAKGSRLSAIKSSVKDIITLWFTLIVRGERKPIKKGHVRRLKNSEWLKI